MSKVISADILVIGGGLAGIVTALESVRAGMTVILADRDTADRLGGLALWAFGGMMLVNTPLQQRMKIVDSAKTALDDWLRFGELDANDPWPLQWAHYYAEHSRSEVYDWLSNEGIKFLPAVNWVERGRFGDGNRVPRYHVIWGTAKELIRCLLAALHSESSKGQLTILHQHWIFALDHDGGKVCGAMATNEANGDGVRLKASTVVLATGGINGSQKECLTNWPSDRPKPATMLNGAHPYADGRMHHWVANSLNGQITHAGEMWNYAAGLPHPYPHFSGHGLSTIPCKSALWLNHRGERIGPEPLVTGFDTHWLCQRVAEQEKPWTWHLLNWRIASKEFAISGAEHNARIMNKQFPLLMKELIFGHHTLIRQMQRESRDFLVASSLEALAAKMNNLTCSNDIAPSVLQATANAFDANFSAGTKQHNDHQIRLIQHAREWYPDRLRTCKPAPLQKPGAGPYIAIRMQLITRKSLGGLQTDLQSRVLNGKGSPVPGLYCVGEAAGFGGGGAHGKRSLEGTFLPSCIMTARAAVRSIAAGDRRL